MNQSRKSWNTSDIENLVSLVQSSSKPINWTLLAQQFNSKATGTSRSGKQCRERWNLEQSKLKQGDNEEELEISTFFRLYKETSTEKNKWKTISAQLQDIGINWDQNIVKNYFYCSIRKAIRKINKILPTKISASTIRNIKPLTISQFCGVEDCQQNLNIFEKALTSSIKSLNLEEVSNLLMSMVQKNEQYIAEKQITGSIGKSRKLSDSTVSTQFSEDHLSEQSDLNQINCLQNVLIEEGKSLMKPPKLGKNSSQMFFPDIHEILHGQDIQDQVDIDIYLSL